MANAEATRETTENRLFVNRRLACAHIKQPTRETIGDCLFVNLTKNERKRSFAYQVTIRLSCPRSHIAIYTHPGQPSGRN